MATFLGNIIISYVRHFFNMNPENEKAIDFAGSFEKFNKGKVPKGYLLQKNTTPSGTRYEHYQKQGTVSNGKLVLYLHGGGYITGISDTYRVLPVDFYKNFDGAETILIDYDLAPAHKYPTQMNQALDLWEHITTTLGYKEENIILGGDSAGGNLTLVLLQNLRDQGKKMPRCAFCISPWADMTGSGDSYIFNYSCDAMFGRKGRQMEESKRDALLHCSIYSFIGDADRTDPYVSPVYGDYHGFPPMFFTVGSHEMLLSDTMTIYKKIRESGGTAELEVGDDMFHIYPLFHTLIPEGKVSYNRIMEYIKRHSD